MGLILYFSPYIFSRGRYNKYNAYGIRQIRRADIIMKDKLLHIPEGVRDIYNNECTQKLMLQDKLHRVLHKYGYHDIQTPSFEFFDIFSHERGTVASKDMYKLFDREGNTLVLRPDITPSIARCIAKYYKDESMPIRLCYIGNTFINTTGYQGKLKETTQLGAELINDPSVEADAELLALTARCLLETGLATFQLEIGNADFFRALVEEAGFQDEDEVNKLRILIENKNMFGVEEMVEEKDIKPELKNIFLQLTNMFGTLDILADARRLTHNLRAVRAIERLERLYEILSEYGYEKYVSFDLGMLSKHNYYTGIIFKAYTYRTGEAIAMGGRYDNLVSQFGKDAPAIGLAIVIDQLMLSLSRQKLLPEPEATDTLLVYNPDCRKQAIALAEHFRRDLVATILLAAEEGRDTNSYLEYAKRMNMGGILLLESNETVRVIDASTGSLQTVRLDELLKD